MGMYFYIHKINKNENEQNILLEMCGNAGLGFGNDTGFYSLTQHTFNKKVAEIFRNFFIESI